MSTNCIFEHFTDKIFLVTVPLLRSMAPPTFPKVGVLETSLVKGHFVRKLSYDNLRTKRGLFPNYFGQSFYNSYFALWRSLVTVLCA